MKIERLAEFIDTYQFSLGSIAYCIGEMRTELEDLGNEEALARADAAKEACDRARQLQYDWDQQKKQESLQRQGATKIDNKLDEALSNLVQMVEPFAEMEVEGPKHRRAEELLDELFPEGVYPVTSKRFEDQHVAVNEILDRLDDSFSEHVETLGLEEIVEHVRELNDRFGETLSTENTGVSYSEVESSYVEAEDAFHALLVRVLADYADDMATLNRVIEPVLEQEKRTARHMQRRGKTPEVDPETGEPTNSSDEPGDETGVNESAETSEGNGAGGSNGGSADTETSGTESIEAAADGGNVPDESSNEAGSSPA
jgi:hypothetical protein